MMKRNYGIVLFLLLFGVITFMVFKFLDGGQKEMDTTRETTDSSVSASAQSETAEIKTDKGVIRVRLFPSETPRTVDNFIGKAKQGYYDNLTFHRVETWVIQGGDPLGTGTGGGDMPTELTQRKFKEGSLGVARGQDRNISNDSQFFICTQDCSWLTGEYTNFGEVISGMDVVKSIAVGDNITGIVVSE